jgi:hypothetical protein
VKTALDFGTGIVLAGWAMAGGLGLQAALHTQKLRGIIALNGFYDAIRVQKALRGEAGWEQFQTWLAAERSKSLASTRKPDLDPFAIYPLDPVSKKYVDEVLRKAASYDRASEAVDVGFADSLLSFCPERHLDYLRTRQFSSRMATRTRFIRWKKPSRSMRNTRGPSSCTGFPMPATPNGCWMRAHLSTLVKIWKDGCAFSHELSTDLRRNRYSRPRSAEPVRAVGRRVGACRRVRDAGMGGFVLKSHRMSTVETRLFWRRAFRSCKSSEAWRSMGSWAASTRLPSMPN